MILKMKRFTIYLPLMIMMLAVSGCSSGILPEQYEQLKVELTSYQQKLAELETSYQQKLAELETSYQQQLEDLNTEIEDLTQAKAALEGLADTSTKLNEEIKAQIEDLTKTNGELENSLDNSTKLNEELSVITAYSFWYDHYYGTGIYGFDNVTAFNSQLGSLIAAIGDTNARSSFDVYHATDYDYITLVASLPEDNVWTLSQYESWVAAGEFRKEALGQVGAHLLNKLETISWFGEK